MRWVLRGIAALVVGAILFVGAIFAASEYGGEVVHLHTLDASGAEHVTHLWVVDDKGYAWLRSGHSDTRWLTSLEAHPDVIVERNGQTLEVHAVPVHDPSIRDRIHSLMRDKYTWADRLVSAVRDPGGSVPVKLQPR